MVVPMVIEASGDVVGSGRTREEVLGQKLAATQRAQEQPWQFPWPWRRRVTSFDSCNTLVDVLWRSFKPHFETCNNYGPFLFSAPSTYRTHRQRFKAVSYDRCIRGCSACTSSVAR